MSVVEGATLGIGLIIRIGHVLDQEFYNLSKEERDAVVEFVNSI